MIVYMIAHEGHHRGQVAMPAHQLGISQLRNCFLCVSVSLCWICGCICGFAQDKPTLVVAAAADMQFAMKEIKAGFQNQSGAQLTVVTGASGNLFEQIENGAPFDVFLSADMEYPRKLVAHHLADGASLFRYAVGRLVLWAPPGSKVDLARLGLNAMLDPQVTKIAIANPQHAPYGSAAVAALKTLKLYNKVSSKLVEGENASQAAQFVESGNAQVGLIPLSLVVGVEKRRDGAYVLVPIQSYPAIDEGAVILAKAANKELAMKFMAFMRHPDTVMLLKKYGFVAAPSLEH
jgi:molybdate transport system substrate-binding protein